MRCPVVRHLGCLLVPIKLTHSMGVEGIRFINKTKVFGIKTFENFLE